MGKVIKYRAQIQSRSVHKARIAYGEAFGKFGVQPPEEASKGVD